jgi:alcohol dehydrogenase class IV
VRELGVPALSVYGVGAEDIARVVEKARKASSMQGNPIELTEMELGEVLGEAMGGVGRGMGRV